ncbi:YpjP family protein [Bacillus pinisoli]|uniref:YpjP family protein n=1 Tax=Bacillus pinisoli TaxID=2901866 RepID=UPI001FF5ABDB|nr:YpjP family protein [Bacillus pinisoli]
MPPWIRKSLVVIFTILTFGLVTPPQIIIADTRESDAAKSNHIEGMNQSADEQINPYLHEYLDKSNSFFDYAVRQAEQQSIMKFGPVIEESIGDEFRSVILPKIEEVIMTLSSRLDEDQLQHLVISKHPTGGVSEKIFHIYSAKSGQDIIRFHVRRDHPPLDGYYFNFHYHTFEDSFQTHHELGTIYWSKNTPPNWQS